MDRWFFTWLTLTSRMPVLTVTFLFGVGFYLLSNLCATHHDASIATRWVTSRDPAGPKQSVDYALGTMTQDDVEAHVKKASSPRYNVPCAVGPMQCWMKAAPSTGLLSTSTGLRLQVRALYTQCLASTSPRGPTPPSCQALLLSSPPPHQGPAISIPFSPFSVAPSHCTHARWVIEPPASTPLWAHGSEGS